MLRGIFHQLLFAPAGSAAGGSGCGS